MKCFLSYPAIFFLSFGGCNLLSTSPPAPQAASAPAPAGASTEMAASASSPAPPATPSLPAFAGHRDIVAFATFSRDAKRIFTLGRDATLGVWDAGTGEPLGGISLEGHKVMPGVPPPLSPDKSYVVLFTEGKPKVAEVFDLSTGALRFRSEYAHFSLKGAKFSYNGTRLALVDQSVVKVYDTQTGKLLFTLGEERGPSFDAVEFSSQGTLLTSRPASRETPSWSVTWWDSTTGTQLSSYQASAPIADENTTFSPDDNLLAVDLFEDIASYKVLILEAKTGALLHKLGPMPDKGALKFSADGSRLLHVSKELKTWDPRSGALLMTIKVIPDDECGEYGCRVSKIKFSPGGEYAVVSYESQDPDESIPGNVLLDTHTGKKIASLEDSELVWTTVFSPDGQRLLVRYGDGNDPDLLDTKTGKHIAELVGHGEGKVQSAEFSEDSARVVTTSREKVARVYDAKTGTLLWVLGAKGVVPGGTTTTKAP